MAVDVGQIHEAARLRGVNKRSAKRALNEALRTARPQERRFVRALYHDARRKLEPDKGSATAPVRMDPRSRRHHREVRPEVQGCAGLQPYKKQHRCRHRRLAQAPAHADSGTS